MSSSHALLLKTLHYFSIHIRPSMVWPYLFFHHQLKSHPLLFFLSLHSGNRVFTQVTPFVYNVLSSPSSPDEFLLIVTTTVQAFLLQEGLSFRNLPSSVISAIVKSLSSKYRSFAGFVKDVTLHGNKYVNTQKVFDSFPHWKFNNHVQKRIIEMFQIMHITAHQTTHLEGSKVLHAQHVQN